VEFTEYRPYRQGDDPRRLDWKLLARTDRAYVRLSDDHTVLPTTLVVDASASMAYPLATLGKWQLACHLAVGLSAVTQTSGDPVGLVAAAGDQPVADVRPSSRRGTVGAIAATLAQITPGAGHGTGISTYQSRGRLVIISDFLQSSDAEAARARASIAAGVEVYAVHVVAREELDPPPRAIMVSDPENVALRRPLIGTARATYLAAFTEWRATLQRDWIAVGASFYIVATDESPARAVRRIVTAA